jgi:WD40 repeat protein
MNLTLVKHNAPVIDIAMLPQSSYMVSISDDHTMQLWDTADGAHLGGLDFGEFHPRDIAAFPDGRHVAVAERWKGIKIFDLVEGREVLNLPDCRAPLAVAGDLLLCVICNYTDTLESDHFAVWDLNTKQVLYTVLRKRFKYDHVESIAVNPNGEHFVVCLSNARFTIGYETVVAELHTGKELLQIQRAGFDCTFTSDGRYAASGLPTIWDTYTGEEIAHFHDLSVYLTPFQRTNPRLCDSFRRHLNMGTLRVIEDAVPTRLTFSPDNRYLIGNSRRAPYPLRVWDVASDDVPATFYGHHEVVSALRFTPDGTRLVTASRDHTLRIWNWHEMVGSLSD